MIRYSTDTWGYTILSNTSVNFYHVLLPKVNAEELSQSLSGVLEIIRNIDGSITVTFSSGSSLPFGLKDLISYFFEQEKLLDAVTYTYEISPQTRVMLKSWFVAMEGCLAILLTHESEFASIFQEEWEIINSNIGGLFISPYTIFLYENYSRVIHPVTSRNFDTRRAIEQKTAKFVRGIVRRMEAAQPGMEGVAMVSYVVEKTGATESAITDLIHQKCIGIKTPEYAPFFTGFS
ncbi:MAG: hypothetical protein HY429_04390 [Candidatus Levybacteria bacterium]|nr:hypothetical protein [Candidatus Levybacteria bacterium]